MLFLQQVPEGQGETLLAQRWNSLEVTKGNFGPEDTVNDIAEIKFERPVPIKVSIIFRLVIKTEAYFSLHP